MRGGKLESPSPTHVSANRPHVFQLCRIFIIIWRIITMRRLHQVVLATVAVASILGFLLYKHEYDRLSNLLEVLNTFGMDSDNGHSCSQSDFQSGLPASHDALLGIWQQIENVYVYSGFAEGDMVKVIGIVPSSISFKDIGVSRCLFWYDPSVKQQYSELTIKFVDEEVVDWPQESWKIVSLKCAIPGLTNAKKKPYAVSLTTATHPESAEDVLPQIHLQWQAPPPSKNSTLAVCAALHSPYVDAVLLTQFLKFHRQVGATKFTFYDLGISPPVQNRIQALASEHPDVEVRILPWNFPFEFTETELPVAASFVRWDCVVRHAGASFVLFAPVADLVVPKYHSHLTNFLRDEDEVGGRRMGRAQLKERVFCTELESNPYMRTLGASVWPMYLKTAWVDGAGTDYFLVKPAAVRAISAGGGPILAKDFTTQEISDEVAVVHAYRNCSLDKAVATNYDNSMVRRFLNHMK